VAVGDGSLEIGRRAPEFSLRDQHNVPVGPADFPGRAILVVFYPLAFTGVCSGELEAIQGELEAFQNDRVQVLTISVDSPYTLRVFADQHGFKFPMLSDFWPHGKVAQDFGVFNSDLGVAARGTFLIDPAGVVRWKVVNDIPHARDQAEYHKAIAAL
jgi:peroxiredoxin